MKGMDILGNIALVKFERKISKKEKILTAKSILKDHKNVSTVLEKTGKIKGRLRTPTSKYLFGIKTKEVLYRENGCIFRFNIDTCYFSPRLSQERAEIASIVKLNEKVLVLFAGVAPFSIVIAKQKKAKQVVSLELGKEPSKYALENVKRNKVNVNVIQGDARKKLPNMDMIFDRIVMSRPNLKDSFLDVVFPKVKKNGIIHYYGFYKEEELDKLSELIKNEAKKARKSIKILRIKKAGDIGVRQYRYRADIKIIK